MKRLIVCLDGTWMRLTRGVRSTNIVNIMRALPQEDEQGVQQLVYYGRGLGSYDSPTMRLLGGFTGVGLEEALKDAYVFLANNYEDGDEIYLFGFSRGAYTARSLAYFIEQVGLLDRFSLGRLKEAWEYYRASKKKREKLSYKKPERDIEIDCVGVFDTVGARGIPMRWFWPADWYRRSRYGFHNVSLGRKVRCALHALAIDEKRGPFQPRLWERPEGDKGPDGQHVKQVWFAGCHADIGGGVGSKKATPQEIQAEAGLPDLALEWMVLEVQKHTNLRFRKDWRSLKRRKVKPDPRGPLHSPLKLPGGLMYAVSWFFPYQRVIGGQHGWTRPWWFLRSSNKPKKGNEFIEERIHASLEHRRGKIPKGTKRAYNPRSVQSAYDAKVPVEAWEPPVEAPTSTVGEEREVEETPKTPS